MTQAEFGLATGKNRDVITSYELGRVVPDDAYLMLLEIKYGYRAEWIRTGEGDQRPPESLAFNVARVAKQAARLDPEEIRRRIIAAVEGMEAERVVLMWQLYKTSHYVKVEEEPNAEPTAETE